MASAMRAAKAFTLIELIIVMTMLTTIVAISAPKMSQFFYGRTLKEETRRFLSIIQYARNESISSAIPLELQVNIEKGQYTIFPVTGYEWVNQENKLYELEQNLQFDVLSQENDKIQKNIARIYFLPDGFLDDRSLRAIQIKYTDNHEDTLWIAQTDLGVRYKILKPEEFNHEDILSQ